MLLMDEECHDGVSVIAILGLGGLGKTTLAQLVYNDRNVKQSFHKRAWVCVSFDFNVISITRTLYESITGESADSKGLDMLQVRLKEDLGKSKFLIVLGKSKFLISSCLECESLPPLGQLPELKHLLIGSMPNVRCISTEFYGSGVMVPFPKLETLRFDHMPEWKQWAAFADGEDIKFPHLHQLTMSGCSKLTRVSPLNLPVLREMDVEECSKVLLESFCNLDSLYSLKVVGITGLSFLPKKLTLSLSALEILECRRCNELLSLLPKETPLEHLTHLRSLVVADCNGLVSFGEGEQQFRSKLKHLEILGCNALE